MYHASVPSNCGIFFANRRVWPRPVLTQAPQLSSAVRVLLKAGPQSTARHGPAAWWPGGPVAHTVLLSSGKSPHMHRFSSGLGAQMKDGEFEFVYHFNNHFNLFFRCMLQSEKRCHSLLFSSVYNNKQKQGFK